MTAGDEPGLTGGGDAGHRAQRGPDLLSSSGDEPRAEDRLRQALERCGVLAWTRSHRLLVGGLAAVLVVVAAGSWYVSTRPPAVDPVVDVSIAGFASGASSDLDALHRTRAALTYQVTVHAAGDVDTAVGVVGPGLTNPSSTISEVKLGLPRVGDLGATMDCTDSRWWGAKDADYRARVRRTDIYGRVTTYDAPLGRSDGSWHVGVRSACLRTFVKALPPGVGSASVVPGQHMVKVTLTLTNPSRHALWLQATGFEDGTVATTVGPLTPLPAGGAATVETSIRATDCTNGAPRLPMVKDAEGVPGQDVALPVYLTDTKVPANHQLVAAWPRVDAASTARLNRQLATLCPNAR